MCQQDLIEHSTFTVYAQIAPKDAYSSLEQTQAYFVDIGRDRTLFNNKYSIFVFLYANSSHSS